MPKQLRPFRQLAAQQYRAGRMTRMTLKSSKAAFGLLIVCLGQPGACKDRAPINFHNQRSAGLAPISEQLTTAEPNSTMTQTTRCRPLTRTHGHHTLGIPISISEWEILDDEELNTYFQADEADGIRRKSCGPTRTPNGTIRWISGIVKGSPDFEQLPKHLKKNSFSSGPCCPNGHTCECLMIQRAIVRQYAARTNSQSAVRVNPNHFAFDRLYLIVTGPCPPTHWHAKYEGSVIMIFA